jgi:NADH dehydrogenase
MSAIGADPQSASDYARTKGKAELAVREAIPEATVLRPSILFGPEDDFFNRFAALARMSPVLPLIAGGSTRFQPAFVGDVAEAVARVIEGAGTPSGTYELGGPDIRTFKDLLTYICAVTGRKRLLLPLSSRLAYYPAMVSEVANGLAMGALPSAFQLTRDQLKLLESDNVVSAAAQASHLTLPGLGIQPQSIESVVPTYLYRFRKSGQFDKNRQPA